MKIITKCVMDMNTMTWRPELEESFEYSGEVALCDRNAVSQASNADKTATNTAAGLGATASGELATVQPFFQQEMKAQHGYTPEQTNELLTAAGAGTGGAAGSLTGQAQLEQARTRNASGFTKSLDEMARDKEKALAGSSEGVAAQDVELAKQENQMGAQGEAGLYGTNTSGMLNAMGQEHEDVQAEADADKTGWMQNLDQTISAVGSLMPKPPTGCWVAAAVFNEDFNTGVKTNLVRDYLWNTWQHSNSYAKYVLAAYTRFGKWISTKPVLVKMLTPLFNLALSKAQKNKI